MKSLVRKVINKLRKKKLTISVVESFTGGLLSTILTSAPGASKYFTFGLVTYSNQSKISLLKIPKKLLIKHGAGSKQTSIAMVKNLNKITKTHISVSTTGIAGPSGGTPLKPVGLVYLAIKNKKKIIVKKFLFNTKNRKLIQTKSVKNVFEIINRTIT